MERSMRRRLDGDEVRLMLKMKVGGATYRAARPHRLRQLAPPVTHTIHQRRHVTLSHGNYPAHHTPYAPTPFPSTYNLPRTPNPQCLPSSRR